MRSLHTQPLMVRVVLLAVLATLMDSTSSAQNAVVGKVTIAVSDFDLTPTVIRQNRSGYVETPELTSKFVTRLVNSRKFNVIERAQLQKVLDELDMTASGLVGGHAQRMKELLGVDYFVMGTISALDLGSTYKALAYDRTRYTRTLTGHVIADMRIVETETGRIIAAETASVSSVERILTRSKGGSGVPGTFVDQLERRLVDQLVQYAVDACYPIKVINDSDGAVVYLNRGSEGGLSVGSRLIAYSMGEALIDPDTGANLGAEETRIAILEVIEILDKVTKATVVTWQGDARSLKSGSLCRRQKPSAASGKGAQETVRDSRPRLPD